jgi:hypothetical protein
VYATERQLRCPEGSQVSVWAENLGSFLVVDIQQLLKVKNLDTMTGFLATNDNVMFVCPDLSPTAWCYASGLRETA